MPSRSLLVRLGIGMLAIVIAGCATATGDLQTGMTPDQAISAMGQPDLRDSVPDPQKSGATVLRYTWVKAGKAATFSTDNHVANIEAIQAGSATAEQAAAEQQTPAFDPIQTPLNYAFYPFKFALYWVGAGINCVGSGDCRRPTVPPPT